MNNIERALFLVCQGIGDEYDVPADEFIFDEFNQGEKFRNPYFGQEAAAVKFQKGTQKELDVWLKETKDKYPVIWLVYPVTSEAMNTPNSREYYPGARLVFAENNTAVKSVDERIHTTKVVLENIVEKFLGLMRQSSHTKYISMDKTKKYKKTFFPNYSVTANQQANATIEIWDAITLDCDFFLIPSCIPAFMPVT